MLTSNVWFWCTLSFVSFVFVLYRFPNYHVYNVVANVNDYKYFVPWCVDSRILKRTSPTFMEAQLAVGFQLFSERYTSEVLLEPQTKIIVHAKQTQLFHYLTNEWSFQPGPHPEHDTWLSFKVDFQFRSLLYAQASHLFFDEVVSKMVAAFERRCEVTWDPKLYPQLTMKNNANGSVAVPITNKGKTNKETIIHVVPVSSSSPQSTASIPPSLHLPPSFSSSTSIPKINTIITSKIVPVLTNVPQASSTIVSRKEEHNEHSPSHHKLPPPLRGSVWL